MTRCPRCQRRLPPSSECPIHGRSTGIVAEAVPPPEVTPPPGWRIERHLATGGTAHVFAVRREDGMPAILKWGRWRERDIYLRFELEARVLRTVGSAWTAALIDGGVADGWPYILMELVAGETLAAWMARTGDRGGLGEILALLDQLAAGLGAIHAAGIVHRDLKPENAVIGPRGVRLIDFGLARQPAVPGLTQIGAVVGTVHYLAPEQVTGAAVDHRADLYSFGVVGFEMLCGRPPFVGERRAIEYQHTLCRPPSVRELRAVPDELDALIAACLAKQPDARPRSAAEIRARIARAQAGSTTARGVSSGALGVRGKVALLWTAGAAPIAVVRAASDVSGMVIRRRGDGVLAAFTGLDHDTPLSAALTAAQALIADPSRIDPSRSAAQQGSGSPCGEGSPCGDRARSVIHVATALLRRSAQGKVLAYGEDVERVERWLPAPPFADGAPGILLTAAAAELLPDAAPSPDIPGFFRPGRRDRTDQADARTPPPLVGRGHLIESLVAVATGAIVDARPVHVAITGDRGAGKSRVLEAIGDRLRAAGREVIALAAERRFPGERPDDRVAEALGGGELLAAIERTAARGAVIAIDDAGHLPAAPLRALERVVARDRARLALLTASAAPIGEREASHRIDVALPALGFEDAELLVRERLRPARLVPGVLVERLAVRAGGNPGLLIALAGEITRRGAVRRQVGSDDWYVAADELDTLLAAPSPAWFAVRALEDLPAELAALVRTCAGLGPRFSADELAAVRGGGDLAARLAWLVQGGVLDEARGWYRFRDAAVADAIYDHALDERDLVHGRALRYWLERPGVDAIDRLARLAYHGAGAQEPVTAVTCWLALARAARDRGDTDIAEDVLSRARTYLQRAAPATRQLAAALAEALGEARGTSPAAQPLQRSSRPPDR